MKVSLPQPVDASPIRSIPLVDCFERPHGLTAAASSLPGHLIQFTIRGVCEHDVQGRRHTLRRGEMIWFHNDESVHVSVRRGPWRFYTLNFTAPSLPPPGDEARVFKAPERIEKDFARLHDAWRGEPPGLERTLRVHALTNALLARVCRERPVIQTAFNAASSEAGVWWALEHELRRDLAQPISLSKMTAMTGKSAATLARACRAATGLPPMRRIKQVRLSLARGLVRFGDQPISHIAYRVGYDRVHELSRDYRKAFQTTPTEDRRLAN